MPPRVIRCLKVVLMIFGIVVVSLPFIVAVKKPAPREGIKVNAILFTQEELEQVKKKATEGDGNAAMDLFNYYTYIEKDNAKAGEYLQLANRLGNSRAVEMLQKTKEENNIKERGLF